MTRRAVGCGGMGCVEWRADAWGLRWWKGGSVEFASGLARQSRDGDFACQGGGLLTGMRRFRGFGCDIKEKGADRLPVRPCLLMPLRAFA
jgi:hypothetical protein